MEFEVKEINGSTVYVRKDKKVIPQREDFPGDKHMSNIFNVDKFMAALHGCTHECHSCGRSCSVNEDENR